MGNRHRCAGYGTRSAARCENRLPESLLPPALCRSILSHQTMPIFHEQAFRAGAAWGQGGTWLRREHFDDWRGVVEALDRLCLEQRCDAISADWLPFRRRFAPPNR